MDKRSSIRDSVICIIRTVSPASCASAAPFSGTSPGALCAVAVGTRLLDGQGTRSRRRSQSHGPGGSPHLRRATSGGSRWLLFSGPPANLDLFSLAFHATIDRHFCSSPCGGEVEWVNFSGWENREIIAFKNGN